MRANGLINFVVVTSATACLLAVVTKSSPDKNANSDFYNQLPSKKILLPDSPITEPPELNYNFNDNNGKPPMFDPKSKLYLENPENIKTEVEYNPKTGTYDVKQKMGDLDYRPETYMSMKEYQDYQFKKSMRDYWRSRVAADDLNEKPRKGMIPKLQVNSELFDRIFGGNTVDIKPTGTAELIFGLNRNKNFNPAIPQRQQKITNFDFNMRIQLNLIGKIGDKLKVTTNYNTEASFDWENQVKLDYTGYEDEIIKKIEAGNVTLPLNSTLISGSQTLFGLKTQLQFGKLTATTVFSQQRGKKQEVTVQGGAQTQNFQINGDNYEQNKHFFLGHYFRDNYDAWMGSLPVINTPIVITKVEVYVLNINGTAEQTRNVVAFEDLGEDSAHVFKGLSAYSSGSVIIPSNYAITDGLDVNPSNDANNLYSIMTNTVDGLLKDRVLSSVSLKLPTTVIATNTNNTGGSYMDASRDYNVIQNARRLNQTEYFFNPRTGFISLNQQLSNEQSLAVSYQYTFGGKTYQVGEFSDQVPDNNALLVCKLLKSNNVSVKHPLWDLMMKNVYALGAYNLNAQDFKLDVYYNNIETGVDVPYIPFGKINGIQLIRVLKCDNLSVNGDKVSDGVFDFIKDYTILPNNGRVYFPTVEPFGRSLAKEFDQFNDFPGANKYIFTELYDSTKTGASFIQNKNRYKIKGTYRSASGSEIALNALNIPQGAVVVTANGIALTENTDYTVDYTLGRVKIINEGILNSGATVKVSLESNSLFNVQQKSLWGTRLDYKAGRNLTLGSTILRFNERPITQKVSIGDEPVSNIVAGLDFNYKTDAPFITRLLDKLPLYSTKEMSTISTRGEFAKLFPGNAKAIGKSGNSYIDDFEGSISLIDVRNPQGWYLASIPQGIPSLFPEAVTTNTTATGLNRARFNWYNIDPMFTRSQSGTTPSYYNNQLFSNNMWRQVFETELFPGKTPPNGQQVVLPVLDLGFYPTERGPYNYDVNPTQFSGGINQDGTLKNPQNRWGGIMRRLETNDFQAANIEYIQFWMMDPFNEDYDVKTHPDFDKTKLPVGDLFINLGNISEDIVKDGRMVYENGIPGVSDFSKSLPIDSNNVSNIPLIPPTVNAFSQDNNDREFQDVGYDGLSDSYERYRFRSAIADMQSGSFNQSVKDAFLNDPSSDKYHFFRGDDYDAAQENTLKRYSKYNNPEGNSPTEAQYKSLNSAGYSTAASTIPNIEDVNRDNTLSETENYYQYHIKISPNDINQAAVGTNYIVDAFNGTADFGGINKNVKWYQFKIPISQFESVVGGIEGFNSIRFMRVYMKGFERPVLVRLARFELVRADWRRYAYDLKQTGEYIANDDNSTSFDVSAVSLQENGTKVPVNYVLPPDISQQQNVQTTNLVLQNEQALQMRVCNLKDGDSRAVFKNVDLDTRMFNNIKMNVHAEKLNDIPLNDGDLTLFFRVGTDYNNNFYEYEVPLKLTPKGVYDPNSIDDRYIVWPADNEINFKFSDITIVKNERNTKLGYFSNLNQLSQPYVKDFGGYKISVVGNPNLGTIKSVMVGIRNNKGTDNLAHCAEVWVNELRLTEFINKGGWATTGQVQAKLADLGTVSLAGTYKTPYWGGVEQKINERSRETNLNWDFSSSTNAGKFFPNKWKVTLPVFYNYGQSIVTPLFNPIDPDIKMDDFNKNSDIPAATKKDIKDQVLDFNERKGFNLTNVRIDGFKRKGAKPMPWDVSNFAVTYAYTELFKRNVNVEYNINRQYRGNIQYAYNITRPFTLKPFTKVKIFQNKWFALIKDFNLQLMPNSFGTSVDLNRTYAALKNRDITSFYAGSNVFENPTLVNKNFLINRAYNLRWDFTKSIKFDYTANNEGRVLERYGEVFKEDKAHRDDIVNTFMNGKTDTTTKQSVGKFGENTTYRQQMNLNVNLPLNKIPILDFTTVTYRYGGTYTWLRRPFAATDSIGNTIQNTNSHNITGNFNLIQLYNKIPYFKRLNTNQQNKSTDSRPGKGAVSTNSASAKDTTKKKDSNFKDIGEFLARGIMMIKNLSISFQEQGGQGLPNFKPSSQYGGMDFSANQAPGFLFTTGLHDDAIRQNSAKNGWIARNTLQTTPYIETKNRTYTYRSSIEPHGSLKIELNGNYTKSSNVSQYMIYDPANAKPGDHGFVFDVSKNETGNFNISTFTFFRSFTDKGTGVNSALFDEFLLERRNVANELGAANAFSTENPTGSIGSYTYTNIQGNTESYVDGYGNSQQDVLLGAFYRTYTGRNVKNYSTQNIFPKTPLPNFTINWDGLGKLSVFKKTFRSITVRHGYRSTYNINGFSNNILFTGDAQTARAPVSIATGTTAFSPNFVPYYNINAITITEAFSPLVKFDFQFVKQGWSANVETKRDKSTSLNITGPQVIETKGQEYIVGLGYMYPKLKIKGIQIQGKVLESNLLVKLDVSYRRNLSIIRRVSDGISIPTGGTDILTLRSSADYQLTQNINLRLFYDWIRTKPQTSASFPTANATGGFSLRINFQ
ncbi:MAG: cell surface protein SprA [Bacteroidota bacterium]|nr:cell surface protein SprA [Bacteroidota bacterium]MDP3144460.1 cell surface protein SprA [Bacteroidota bacterium]